MQRFTWLKQNSLKSKRRCQVTHSLLSQPSLEEKRHGDREIDQFEESSSSLADVIHAAKLEN